MAYTGVDRTQTGHSPGVTTLLLLRLRCRRCMHCVKLELGLHRRQRIEDRLRPRIDRCAWRLRLRRALRDVRKRRCGGGDIEEGFMLNGCLGIREVPVLGIYIDIRRDACLLARGSWRVLLCIRRRFFFFEGGLPREALLRSLARLRLVMRVAVSKIHVGASILQEEDLALFLSASASRRGAGGANWRWW